MNADALLINGASALVQGHAFERLDATLEIIRRREESAGRWLDDVYSLVDQGKSEQAVDLLYEHVDDLLLAEDFKRCDALLQTVDLKRLDSNLMVSLLTMTAPAKAALPYRASLLQRARKALETIAPGRADRLLMGL